MSRSSAIITRSRGLKIAEKEQHMKEVIREINGRVVNKMNNMIIVEFEYKNPKNDFCPISELILFKLINNKVRAIYGDLLPYSKRPLLSSRNRKYRHIFNAIEEYLKSYN
jgi:hypothetical protein